MKHEITSTKSETSTQVFLEARNNSQNESKSKYDLEDRTLNFAANVRSFVRSIQKDIANIEVSKQLVRSSGSIGANYIEANEALSKKDFLMRTKIARKEAKESGYWLRLLAVNESQEAERLSLYKESTELMKILSAILRSSES